MLHLLIENASQDLGYATAILTVNLVPMRCLATVQFVRLALSALFLLNIISVLTGGREGAEYL